MKRLSLLFTVLVFLQIQVISQVAINDDGTQPDESSILHVKSTDKGILIPRMTESQRLAIGSPATGLLVYQTDDAKGFYYNSGSSSTPDWIKLSTNTSEITDADGDTKVEVEQSTDDDNIVLTTAGNEAMVIDENAYVGIGTDSPLGLLHAYQPIEYSGEAVDQVQDVSNVGSDQTSFLWQSFTAGATGYLSKVEFWDGGNSVGTYSISVYEGEGVSGTLLGSTTTVSRNNDPYEYVPFPLTTEVQVTSGQQYTFAMTISGNWEMDVSSANPYAGGVLYRSGNIYPNYDSRFKTYVASTVSQGPLSFILSSDGYVGIGNTSPTQKLDVTGNVKISGNIIQDAGSSINTDEVRAESANGLLLNDDAGNGMQIMDGGRVVIGDGSSVAQLTLYGDATNTAGLCIANNANNSHTWLPYIDGCNYITGDYTVSMAGHTIFRVSDGSTIYDRMIIRGPDGLVGINTLTPTAVLSVNGAADKPGGGDWGSYSDSRSKENMKDYDRGLHELMRLKPVFYNYKREFGWGNKTYVGLMAQDVEKVIPEMVEEIEVKDIKDFKRVDPSELTYLLINAVKEQQEQIDELIKQNQQLEERVSQMEKSKNK